MDKLERLKSDPLEKKLVEVPLDQHDDWKESWGPSFSKENFFDHDELEWLTDLMYREHKERRVKKNGTLHFNVDNEIIKNKFFDKIKTIVPELDDTEWHGNFLITSTPYNLHVDTGVPESFNDTAPGKQIIIPLYTCWTGHKDKPEDWYPDCGTAFFKNRFIMYGTNFAKSDSHYDTNVFYTVRNYNNLVCYNQDGSIKDVDWNAPIDEEVYQRYFTHYNRRWLDGFELEAVHNWKRGNIIVFDRSQTHSGVNFMKHNVTMKAGLSLMTTRRKKIV